MDVLQVLVTSEGGRRVEAVAGATTPGAPAAGPRIRVFPAERRQTIDGIGGSFTQSSAYVLAHLPVERRRAVMERLYGQSGARFSLARTHIGSCDFTVDGKYAYVHDEDAELSTFSVAVDRRGFDRKEHPGVQDPAYDLLPMIEEARAIQAAQGQSPLRIIASAWTAPPWMKDVGDWYLKASERSHWQGTGGKLLPEFEGTYAAYLVKYVEAYAAQGVPIWAITPVNEPGGNNGQWESMHFTPESQRDFIKQHLGPRLRASAHRDTRLLMYDHNRDHLLHWADVILGDTEARAFVDGIGVHWYSSTVEVHEELFDELTAKYPGVSILHTEGCIDDLGKDAPEGVADPIRFKESGWFGNDDFWWNENATDWGYTAEWAVPSPEDHPIYTPVHRYARDVIVGVDHWVTGWVDWNVVLDAQGGPNHVGNFCGAPIMIDRETGEVHETPVFHVLAQLSRTIRPGDVAVRTARELGGLGGDDLHACATVGADGVLNVQLLNTTKAPLAVALDIGGSPLTVALEANSVTTVRVRG